MPSCFHWLDGAFPGRCFSAKCTCVGSRTGLSRDACAAHARASRRCRARGRCRYLRLAHANGACALPAHSRRQVVSYAVGSLARAPHPQARGVGASWGGLLDRRGDRACRAIRLGGEWDGEADRPLPRPQPAAVEARWHPGSSPALQLSKGVSPRFRPAPDERLSAYRVRVCLWAPSRSRFASGRGDVHAARVSALLAG